MLFVTLGWLLWSQGRSERALKAALFALPLSVAATSWMPLIMFTDALYRQELLHGWLFGAVGGAGGALMVVLALWVVAMALPGTK